MKKIKKQALPSLIFAVLFLIRGILKLSTGSWIDIAFYFLAFAGFTTMFFIMNKESK